MKKLLLLFLCLTSFTIYAQQAYYNGVNLNLSGTDLRDELATKIISSHTTYLSYTQAYTVIKNTDEDSNNSNNVILLYNSVSESKNLTVGGGNNGSQIWNREHTYPKSLGSPNLGTSGPGSDVHHLRACDQYVNSNRGSLKFVSGSGSYGGSGSGWYPGDEWKGDVARMMMYMYLRYGNQCYPTGVAVGTTNSVDSNMVNLLLDWNAQDPVSSIEDQRNTILESAQGNRNPFIDNPNLATQIWGGAVAEDKWNTVPDTEDPSTPTNLIASNIKNTTIDLNWTASTDNIAISSYQVYVDGTLNTTSTTNSKTVIGLTKNTEYDFTVFAKDAAGNSSTVSNTVTITTDNFIDIEAPSAIVDLNSSNISSSSADLSWTASTDNIGVTSYEVYQDGSLIDSSITNTYSASGLNSETSYNFTVYAKDAAQNTSTVSNTELVTTLAIPSVCTSESFNNMPTNSSSYSIRNWTGDHGGSWTATNARTDQTINERAIVTKNGVITAPINIPNGIESFTVTTKRFYSGGAGTYNLKVNGVIVGQIPYSDVPQTTTIPTINLIGNVSVTLDRATGNTGDRVGFDDLSWECYSTLSTKDFKEYLFNVYPNPTSNNSVTLTLKNTIELNSIEFYTVTGQLIKQINHPTIRNKKLEINNIPSGLYIVKIESDKSYSTKRLIVN